jgi:hypothetical protein
MSAVVKSGSLQSVQVRGSRGQLQPGSLQSVRARGGGVVFGRQTVGCGVAAGRGGGLSPSLTEYRGHSESLTTRRLTHQVNSAIRKAAVCSEPALAVRMRADELHSLRAPVASSRTASSHSQPGVSPVAVCDSPSAPFASSQRHCSSASEPPPGVTRRRPTECAEAPVADGLHDREIEFSLGELPTRRSACGTSVLAQTFVSGWNSGRGVLTGQRWWRT